VRPSMDPAADPRVAVVVLTCNQREMTLRSLGALERHHRDAHVLLWDNGSTDGTADAVASAFPHLLVHRSPTNLGVAGGRNAAARLALEHFGPTHLLFLDNDMLVTEGCIDALLQAFADDPTLGQAGGKFRFLDNPTRLNDAGGCRINFWIGSTEPTGYGELDEGQYDEPRSGVVCGGAMMMVRADVFRQLGGFDERFNPYGPEDLDFSLRLQAAGYGSRYVPTALGYHRGSQTFAGAPQSLAYTRNRVRQWLRFLYRHGSLKDKVGFFLVGAPFRAARMAVRLARSGHRSERVTSSP
jgi:GT2 family glycosyltransferase